MKQTETPAPHPIRFAPPGRNENEGIAGIFWCAVFMVAGIAALVLL